MPKFSERNGYTNPQMYQFESLENGTRNRITTFLRALYEHEDRIEFFSKLERIYFKSLHNVGYGNSFDSAILRFEEYVVKKAEWFEVFDILEFVSDFLSKTLRGATVFQISINAIFEQENVGYRMVDSLIVPITDESEVELLTEVTSSEFATVNTHMSKAIDFFSDRENPDYSNSIKESISAVEAMAKIIVGNDKGVLSSALDKLGKKGIKIHPALIEGFKNLYGFTSDAGGIRHAKKDFAVVEQEDAKYMLMSNSVFIRYLMEKYRKMEV